MVTCVTLKGLKGHLLCTEANLLTWFLSIRDVCVCSFTGAGQYQASRFGYDLVRGDNTNGEAQ